MSLKVVRIHKLTVRIERREHAFHRGIDQVVIANLFGHRHNPADQLDGFGERRDFRVAVLIGRNGRRFWISSACYAGEDREKSTRGKERSERAEKQTTPHKYHVWTQTTRLSFIPLLLPTGWYDKVRIPF
jgi:hypothetical protein